MDTYLRPTFNLRQEEEGIMKRRSTIVLLCALSLFFCTGLSLVAPLPARATPVLYSVTGTGTEDGIQEISNVYGYMIISDEPDYFNVLNPNTDSSVTYDIESYKIYLEGIASDDGSSFMRFEWDGGVFNIGGLGSLWEPRFQFYHSDGSSYDTTDLAEYCDLAPIITFSGETGHFGDSDWIGYLDLTLTPVPEPTTMLLLASGLAGLAGFRKRLKKN
jgi:hypothetical protein